MPVPAASATPTSATARHPDSIVAAHWLTALAIVLTFSIVLWREAAEGDALRSGLLGVHRVLGLLIGLLAIGRLALRWRRPLASTLTSSTRGQRVAAAVVHGLLYALLLTLPVLGVLLTNARGHLVTLPVLGALPPLTARDLDWADSLEDWHGALAWLLAALVAAHAAAALWHHWARRNDVLTAMAPWLRRRT